MRLGRALLMGTCEGGEASPVRQEKEPRCGHLRFHNDAGEGHLGWFILAIGQETPFFALRTTRFSTAQNKKQDLFE